MTIHKKQLTSEAQELKNKIVFWIGRVINNNLRYYSTTELSKINNRIYGGSLPNVNIWQRYSQQMHIELYIDHKRLENGPIHIDNFAQIPEEVFNVTKLIRFGTLTPTQQQLHKPIVTRNSWHSNNLSVCEISFRQYCRRRVNNMNIFSLIRIWLVLGFKIELRHNPQDPESARQKLVLKFS